MQTFFIESIKFIFFNCIVDIGYRIGKAPYLNFNYKLFILTYGKLNHNTSWSSMERTCLIVLTAWLFQWLLAKMKGLPATLLICAIRGSHSSNSSGLYV